MTDRKEDMSGNQGEGNRAAGRAYDKDQQKFVEEGKVDEAAKEAERAVKSDEERAEMEKAEEEGKSHAKDFDPNVKRDY